jgi:hypothetical protein
MKFFKLALLIVLFSSCASINVDYDYDSQADFSKYKTYNYYSDLDTGLSALDTKRLLDVLDNVLASKGMALSENPDFYINIQSEEYEDDQRNQIGIGVGGSGRNVGGGISVGIPVGETKLNREIIFDFIDNNNGLFWQAVARSSYRPDTNPDAREANLKAIVDKILLGYPPQ